MYNYYYPDGHGQAGLYTDLAIERRRADTDIDGVKYEKEICLVGDWERIKIVTDAGAKSIGRPCGTYDTLTVKRLDTLNDDEIADVQEELAKRLCAIFEDVSVMPARILTVGLGNSKITADSIGPKTADLIKPTMHIREYDEELFDELECSEIAVISPSVPAKTGMDTGTLVRAVCEEIMPDAVIAIDAVCTSARSRLGTTFQLSDTGIFPGGMGNLKTPITRSGVGVPVIGIGVATVIDSRLFAPSNLFTEIDFEPFFISPREIDEITDVAARAIGGAINQAFGLNW